MNSLPKADDFELDEADLANALDELANEIQPSKALVTLPQHEQVNQVHIEEAHNEVETAMAHIVTIKSQIKERRAALAEFVTKSKKDIALLEKRKRGYAALIEAMEE